MSEKNKKLRVLLVSPYSEKIVGGIINWTKYIVNYHSEHNDEIQLRLLNNENVEQIIGNANPLKRLVTGLGNYLPILREFKKCISQGSYDVAHISSSASFGLIRDLLLVKTARKHGVKICVHMHFGRIPQILATKGWENRLIRLLFKNADKVIVMDMGSYNALQKAGYDKMVYLPNPLSPYVVQIIEKSGNLERESRKIVYAGHIVESKGVVELIRACRQIEGVKLECLGKYATPEIKERLIELAGGRQEEWLSVPGNKPFEEVIQGMMTCAVFVLPSHSEGFPNVILEAMACGCPIVATPVGAIPEMLDVDSNNPCGIIVPVRDEVALRQSISDLIKDKEKAKTFGENARRRVMERYSMEKVWKQLVSIWEGVQDKSICE